MYIVYGAQGSESELCSSARFTCISALTFVKRETNGAYIHYLHDNLEFRFLTSMHLVAATKIYKLYTRSIYICTRQTT